MERYANKKDKSNPAISEDETEKVNLSDIKSLGACYWVITFNCLFTYLGIFPFNNISTEFFRSNYNFDQSAAGQFSSITFFISAFGAPFFGFLCDKIGNRVTFCIISATLLSGAHLFYIVLGTCDFCKVGAFPQVMMGIAYSIYVSALWPMIPYVVKP